MHAEGSPNTGVQGKPAPVDPRGVDGREKKRRDGSPPEKDRRDRIVVGLAKSISRLPSGDLAALRRYPPGGAGSGAFWRLYFISEADRLSGRPEDWERLMAGIAILTRPGRVEERASAHNGDMPLGAVLYAISGSEPGKLQDTRLLRLINQTWRQRQEALLRLCRRLVAERRPFDLRLFATLMLFESPEACRRLAKDFYRAATKQEPAARKQEATS